MVVVGIGGSSLGPAFLYEALKATPLYSRLGGREVPPAHRSQATAHTHRARTAHAPHTHRAPAAHALRTARG